MFSTDKNIESISELVELIKDYLNIQKGILVLNVVEKVVRLLTIITLTVILAFFLLLVVVFLSFAVAYALALTMPTFCAFLILAGVYFILFLLVILNRKNWIERPIVKMLASILTE